MSEPQYVFELTPPNIRRWREGNIGIEYAVTLNGPLPGPGVLIMALVHGNEYAGAVALDALLRARPSIKRGRLTCCFANVAAYETFDFTNPLQARSLEADFNRLWSPEILDGTEDNAELRRARALRPLVESADYLLDLHSLRHIAEPLILCGRQVKGRHLAASLGFPRWVVADTGHEEGKRLRDYGPFDDAQSTKTALLVECGPHWVGKTADVALEVTLRFLRKLDLIDHDFLAEHVVYRVEPSKLVDVVNSYTIRTNEFRFIDTFTGFEIVPKQGTVVGFDGEQPVRTPHDDCVIVMPSRNLLLGKTAVRFGRLVW